MRTAIDKHVIYIISVQPVRDVNRVLTIVCAYRSHQDTVSAGRHALRLAKLFVNGLRFSVCMYAKTCSTTATEHLLTIALADPVSKSR